MLFFHLADLGHLSYKSLLKPACSWRARPPRSESSRSLPWAMIHLWTFQGKWSLSELSGEDVVSVEQFFHASFPVQGLTAQTLARCITYAATREGKSPPLPLFILLSFTLSRWAWRAPWFACYAAMGTDLAVKIKKRKKGRLELVSDHQKVYFFFRGRETERGGRERQM